MRHRNMYYLTGQPGWMRFGYSPGWLGRSPSGLGPCAQYLMTGQFPTPQAVPAQTMAPPAGWLGTDQNSRLEFLKNQLNLLEQSVAAVKSQIKTLEEAGD